MANLMDHPWLVFVLSFVALSTSTWIGAVIRRWRHGLEEVSDDYRVVEGAILTLMALIIGFSFSMAINRYDLRKRCEETEANAIGTEYLRAGLLPSAEAAKVRAQMRQYLDQRVLFYEARDDQELAQINARAAQLQADLWATVQAVGTAQPNQVVALAVSGMNDVIDAQGYTQASWWNRIPVEAWGLLGAIAICSSTMLGYGARKSRLEASLVYLMPAILSISFFMISDIDSPRGGVVGVHPDNLTSLAQSLRAAL